MRVLASFQSILQKDDCLFVAKFPCNPDVLDVQPGRINDAVKEVRGVLEGMNGPFKDLWSVDGIREGAFALIEHPARHVLSTLPKPLPNLAE